MTGLTNKSTYKQKCLNLIAQSPDKLGVFFFIDLNDFKQVNDTYGHSIGDKYIIHFSEILIAFALQDDKMIPFRIAGGEFGIFKAEIEDQQQIEDEVRNLESALNGNNFQDESVIIPIQCSVGAAVYNLDTQDFEMVMEHSDIAMYKAKEKKNKTNADVVIELFSPESA